LISIFGVGRRPSPLLSLLLDLGRNFGYFKFGFVVELKEEAFSESPTILGPNLEVLSGFCCFCPNETGDPVESFSSSLLFWVVSGDRTYIFADVASEISFSLSLFTWGFLSRGLLRSFMLPLLFALLLLFN